jgi:beta-galactosidase
MRGWAAMSDNIYSEILSYFEQNSKGLKAREMLSLNDEWKFYSGDAPGINDVGFDDSHWRTLSVPHDYSVESEFSESNIANGFVQAGIVWYRKHLRLPKKQNREKIYLLFDGVAMNSQVWINGHYLGQHPYAYTPFWYDITPFIQFGENEENIIAVKVDASLQPFSRSYMGTGILRNVWLISMNSLHIEQWGVTVEIAGNHKEQAEIMISTKVLVDRYPETIWNAFEWQGCGLGHNNEIVKTCTLVTSIIDRQGITITEAQDSFIIPNFSRHEFKQLIKIPEPKLWSIDKPYLYRIHSKIILDGQIVDDIFTPLGIRTISFDAQNGFTMNGEKLKLKGVCLHQDTGAYGGAVPVKTWIKKLQLLKDMGCNAIRTAHHPFSTEFYQVCDYLGMMVMDEAFDEWRQGWDRGYSDQAYGKNTYGYYLYFDQWHETDLRAMLRRDKNHPCIIMWSVGNEIPELYFKEGMDLLKRLVSICKEEDTTRPVTVCAEGNHIMRIHEDIMPQVDIAGYNYINSREGDAWYDRIHTQHPEWVLLGSETEYEPEHWQYVKDNPFVIGQFLWVGYDYMGEGADVLGEDSKLGVTFDISALTNSTTNKVGQKIVRHGWAFGLLDIIDTPKGEYFYRKSIWSEQPVIQLSIKHEEAENKKSYNYFQSHLHWNWKPGDKKTVYCFTNCEKVELFLNNKSLGIRETELQRPYAFEWSIEYMPGNLKAIGYNLGVQVCESILVTADIAKKIVIHSDCNELKAGGKLDANIAISIIDEQGSLVPNASNRVTVKIKGCGSLLGVISGDMTSNESYRSNSCKAYKGKCMAIIQATKEAGAIELEVEGEGLKSARIVLLST